MPVPPLKGDSVLAENARGMFLRNPDGASQQDIPPGPDGPFPFQKENLKSSGNDCARAAREGRQQRKNPGHQWKGVGETVSGGF